MIGLSRRDRHVLRVLRLEPGDVLLFETDEPMTAETVARIQRVVGAAVPGHEVLVVSKLTPRVFRPVAAPPGSTPLPDMRPLPPAWEPA